MFSRILKTNMDDSIVNFKVNVENEDKICKLILQVTFMIMKEATRGEKCNQCLSELILLPPSTASV